MRFLLSLSPIHHHLTSETPALPQGVPTVSKSYMTEVALVAYRLLVSISQAAVVFATVLKQQVLLSGFNMLYPFKIPTNLWPCLVPQNPRALVCHCVPSSFTPKEAHV